jgi:hypothetical protein
MAVADAPGRDPRTSRAVIDVACLGGSVTLHEQVRTAAEKAAAVEVARGVPGVAAVIDDLEIQAGAARKSWPEAAAESLSWAAGRLGTKSRDRLANPWRFFYGARDDNGALPGKRTDGHRGIVRGAPRLPSSTAPTPRPAGGRAGLPCMRPRAAAPGSVSYLSTQSVPRPVTWYESCTRGRCGVAERSPQWLSHVMRVERGTG